MPRIAEKFLDDLRACLKVSEVVGKRMKLRKAGKDWVAVDDQSFTVSDVKGFYHDFGKSGQRGDIFSFQMWQTGCSFEEAVEDLAKMAGMPMPHSASSGAHRPRAVAGNGADRPSEDDHPNAPGNQDNQQRRRKGGGTVTAVYDYTDGDGTLLYQVCRIEDVNASGKPIKTFMQRRPAPNGLTGWVWGLSSGDFIQGKRGDWFIATEERLNQWNGAAVATFHDGVAHSLYRLPELLDERAQGHDARTVFVTEGEKDSDTLTEWGVLGTTNSGGASNWSKHHAEMFRGMDVVVLLDNDPAGRSRGHMIGASLRGIARRTRVLDWRLHWLNCPEKADVTDWRNHAAGNAEKLFAIVDKLPEWTPQRPDSEFRAVTFNEIEKPSREFEWLIKKILTRGETSLWFGAPGCGKSFLLTDAAMSISRGEQWLGFKTRRGLVVYQAGEGGLGLKQRLRAYRKTYDIDAHANLPFVLLPSPINLFAGDADTDKLIKEINAWSAFYDIPLELVAIDTFSAASAGADENASKDVGPVLARCRRIAMETGAHVALVHHTPKGGGSPRGWSGFTGNVENVIEVIRTDQTDSEHGADRTTVRDIREFVVRKQKDGEDGFGRKFILKQVILGRDAEDDLITSCVVQPLQGAQQQQSTGPVQIPRGYVDLPPNSRSLMRALGEALKQRGRKPAAGTKAPEGVLCVTVGDWQEVRRETLWAGNDQDDPDGKKLRQRIKKQIERTYEGGMWTDKQNLIGKDGEWVWRTERKVYGIDPPPMDRGPDPAMLLAPGEDESGMADLVAGMETNRYGGN